MIRFSIILTTVLLLVMTQVCGDQTRILIRYLFFPGKLNILKYPYPRDVDEIHDYQLITEHFLANNRHRSESPDAQVHSVSSL